jgi:hypothetical protein
MLWRTLDNLKATCIDVKVRLPPEIVNAKRYM